MIPRPARPEPRRIRRDLGIRLASADWLADAYQDGHRMAPDEADRALALIIEPDDADTHGRALWALAAYLDAGNVLDTSRLDAAYRAWLGAAILMRRSIIGPRDDRQAALFEIAQTEDGDRLIDWIIDAFAAEAATR